MPPAALPGGLSMLWESTEPTQCLTDRFGLADLDHTRRWLHDQLAQSWRIEVRGLDRLVISDHNAIAWVRTPVADLVVKWSGATDLFDRLAATTGVLARLADAGLPVAHPVPTASGAVRVVVPGPRGPVSMAVLVHLPGDWLDTSDELAVHDAGVHLARLHDALAGIDDPVLRGDPVPLRGRVVTWLDEIDHRRVPTASDRLRDLIADLPEPSTSPQLVHNDYRAANLLVRERRVAGILDLDEVGIDQPVVDLARASVLLSTLFRDWGPTPPAVRRDFQDGYRSVRGLDDVEEEWLAALELCHGLAMVPDDDRQGWAEAL